MAVEEINVLADGTSATDDCHNRTAKMLQAMKLIPLIWGPIKARQKS